MIDFLITSTISLIVFLGFYHLVLEREKMHQFNRFYLLFSIVISLVIPFITFEIIKEIPVAAITEPIYMPFPMSDETIPVIETIDYTPIVLWSLYAVTTLFLGIRFGKNICKLTSKSSSNPIVKYKNAKLVLVDEKTLPHTFLNSIFINFDDYNQRNIEDELYTHELVHVTQKHTLDILFVEFLKTVFWFNPVLYFYKKAIQLNHEFLADEQVVESYNDVPFYQSLLLQKGNGNQTIYLASNLNYLVTKKRLIMMTKNTSRSIAFLKKIAITPILVALIYFFCIEIVAQEKALPTTNKTEKNLTSEDKIRDRYYSNVRIILKDVRNGITIDKMYEELTLEEKRSYLSWVPDMIISKEVPEPLFQKMKTKNMAVWINGKTSSAAEIQKYKRTDFSHYTYSFVHKNARSKRFPQEYQYTLYTKKYFDENLKNSHLHFGNDTLKMVISNYKKNKVDEILSKTTKPDTIVWQTKGKEGYNLYIKDTVRKKQIAQKPKPMYGSEVKPQKDSTDVKSVAEVTEKPEFELGLEAFYKYIGTNYKIPEEVTKNKLKGRVFASFIVEKDGSLSNIKILRDMGYGTGEEAERVLKNSPKWKPGKIHGKPVRTMYSLPISIKSE
ncbi:M56 family metallopeptidase [Flavobacterium sp. J49]|uniref:M56 family metallopeptidase n=1 Tax=Flavobacterium sp. J49 TaxID=2718534 RepID=UPI001E2E1607|nr:M56 family metallopeptidase [Flavobacterium sp. J49]